MKQTIGAHPASGVSVDYRRQAYCAQNNAHVNLTYDSKLRKYWLGDSHARKHRGGICWVQEAAWARMGKRDAEMYRISRALMSFYETHLHFPEFLNEQGFSNIGYMLAPEYEIASYALKASGPTVETAVLCIQNHNDGGFSRYRVLAYWNDAHDEFLGTEGESVGPDHQMEGSCPL